MKRLSITTIVIALCLLCISGNIMLAYSQEIVQPLGIVPQEITMGGGGGPGRGGSGRGGTGSAYCMDYVAGNPGRSDNYSAFPRGGQSNIRIYRDGHTQPEMMPLGNAISEGVIKIQGKPGPWGEFTNEVRIELGGNHQNITSIEILDLIVTKTGDYSDAYSDEELNRFSRHLNGLTSVDEKVQYNIWKEPFLTILNPYQNTEGWRNLLSSVSTARDRILRAENTSTSFRPSQNEYFRIFENTQGNQPRISLDHISLLNGGSATIIRDSRGRLLFIDTGRSQRDALRIMQAIDREYPGQVVDVVITHHDADHVGGLIAMLQRQFNCGEIILPKALNNIQRTQTQLERITASFNQSGYYANEEEEAYLLRFRKNNSSGRTTLEMEEYADDGLQIYTMNPSLTDKYTIFQNLNPNNTNNHSLITKVYNNGVSYLNLGDAEEQSYELLIDNEMKLRHGINEIKSMLHADSIEKVLLGLWMYECKYLHRYPTEENLMLLTGALAERIQLVGDSIANLIETHSIKSTVMIWPHHYYFNQQKEKTFAELLNLVDPQMIIFTNPSRTQDSTQLVQFIDRYETTSGKSIQRAFLEKDGSIRIIAQIDRLPVNSMYATIGNKWVRFRLCYN